MVKGREVVAVKLQWRRLRERGGDGVRSFWKGKRGRRGGGSPVPKVDDIAKSSAVVGEAEGGG
jgi:hypothetical protein